MAKDKCEKCEFYVIHDITITEPMEDELKKTDKDCEVEAGIGQAVGCKIPSRSIHYFLENGKNCKDYINKENK